MMEYLLYFPLGTSWELAFFIGLISAWVVSDYVVNAKPKRSKRTERQIFDGHNEVSGMISEVILTDRFGFLPLNSQMQIVRFINNGYK